MALEPHGRVECEDLGTETARVLVHTERERRPAAEPAADVRRAADDAARMTEAPVEQCSGTEELAPARDAVQIAADHVGEQKITGGHEGRVEHEAAPQRARDGPSGCELEELVAEPSVQLHDHESVVVNGHVGTLRQPADRGTATVARVPERSDVVFANGLNVFSAVVADVDAGAWDNPSPCAGWTARDVLGHLGTSIAMGVSVLRGEQPTWPDVTRPGELVSDEPSTYWREIADEARRALAGADLDLEMDTPMGRRTVADRLAFPAIDLYVHAWDIGRAAGIQVEIPPDVIEFAHSYIDPFPADVVRGPNGAFGLEVPPPPDATPTEAFVAWTGRDPR